MVRKNYINPLLKVVAVAFCSASICLVSNSASSLTYQSSTNVGFTFNPAISISLSGDLLISSLSPGSTSDSNIIDVAINTNASQGYTLTATAGTSSTTTNLVNTGNNNNIFTSLATNATITDWTNANDNTWGYSYSEDNGTTWISGKDGSSQNILGYSGLPLDNDDNGATGKTLISTTLPSDNKTLKFKIGAKASSSQASGDYTNIINFYAVANPEPSLTPVSCPAGKICYNANSLTTVQGQMGQQSATNNSTKTLYAPNFKNDGYGFAGWSDSYTGNGVKYGPSQDIIAPSDIETTGLSLYAMWVQSAGDMQNWTGCANLNKGDVTALKDSRDNNVYAVAKLADNNCWMIENLRLADKDSSNNDINLTSTNTHNPSIPLNNSWYYKNQQGTLTTSNHLSATTDPTQTAWCNVWDYWDDDDLAAKCTDQSMLATNNTTRFIINTNSAQDSDIYSYGNHYNWYSATAGHGQFDANTNGGNVTGDICPSGWRLPRGGWDNIANSDFWRLGVAIIGAEPDNTSGGDVPRYEDTSGNPEEGTNASKSFRSYPNNFVLENLDGAWWSSTAYSDYSAPEAFSLAILIDFQVHPGTAYSGKSEEATVRCVAGT